MKTNFALLREFHARFEPAVLNEKPEEMLVRRATYLAEECKEAVLATDEVMDAENKDEFKKGKAHLVKELVDVLYVTYGFLALLGVDADTAFKEVHASNMSKTPNPHGKAIKGPGYVEAKMERFV